MSQTLDLKGNGGGCIPLGQPLSFDYLFFKGLLSHKKNQVLMGLNNHVRSSNLSHQTRLKSD